MNSTILNEIEILSGFLDMAYLPRTAAAVRALVSVDIANLTRSSWHDPIVEAYRREVESSPNILGESDRDHHRRLLEAMDFVIPKALAHPSQFGAFLVSARTVIEAVGESHGNTRELYRSFVHGQGWAKHTYLNLCLMYLILCEGVFKNQSRFLLGLKAVADERNNETEYLSRALSPKLLVKELSDGGLGVYSEGYHRHVRNSIAHGHMRFEPTTDGMRFRDFEPSDPVNAVFDETWPFSQLASLYAKLDDTYLVVATYLQIHFFPLTVGSRVRRTTAH